MTKKRVFLWLGCPEKCPEISNFFCPENKNFVCPGLCSSQWHLVANRNCPRKATAIGETTNKLVNRGCELMNSECLFVMSAVVAGDWSPTAAWLCWGWWLHSTQGTQVLWRHTVGQSPSAPGARASSFPSCKLRRLRESLEPVHGTVLFVSELHRAGLSEFSDNCFTASLLTRCSRDSSKQDWFMRLNEWS